MHYVKLFAIGLPLMLALDALFLGVIASDFYKARLGAVAKIIDGKLVFHYGPALVTYVLMLIGLVVFVLPKVQAVSGTLGAAFAYGALFGLIVYGVYDFTNATILKEWAWSLLVVDILWGAVLNGITAVVLSRFG